MNIGLPAGAGSSHRASEFDLLRLPWLRRIVVWRGFPKLIQFALLVVFVGLAFLSWGVFAPSGVNAKLFAKSNLVTLLLWGLWWPAMVWVAVLFGRVWCMVCPLELVSGASENFGRRIGWPSRPLPRWIARGALVVGFYLLLQFLVPGIQLHRVPGYTAWFLTTILTLAVVTALVFEKRAFCRGFCPVGLLLGTYGRGGMLAVRPSAGTRENSGGPDARTCPTLLNPSGLDSNQDCLVCCRCIQKAEPGAMRLALRPPFSGADARPRLAPWPVTLFVMVASGFVISEICTEWPAAQAVFLRPAKWAAAALGSRGAAPWLEGVWTLIVVPLGLWLALAALLRMSGQRGNVGALWRSLALPMAVLVAAGHMSKGLAKFVSWLPFLPQALHDRDGTVTALGITAKTLAAPKPLVTLSLVGTIGVILIVTAFVFAVREHRLGRGSSAAPGLGLVPYAAVAVLFLTLVTGWVIQ